MSATAAAGFNSAQRGFMFYAICIPLRLTLAAAVYNYGSNVLVKSTTVAMCLLSLFLNSYRIREQGAQVWWSRRVHILTGLLIVLSVIVSPKPGVPAALLLTDTLFGLSTSFYKQPFHVQ